MLIALLMTQALTIPDNTRSYQLIQEHICAGGSGKRAGLGA